MNPSDASHLPGHARSSPAAALRRRLRRGAAGAAVALVLAVCLVFPAWSQASITITMNGRGWGHGIGMCQWGAYGYAKHGWTYDKILTHYYTGIKLGKVPNDPIRVRLRGGLAKVKVTCTKPYKATVGSTVIEVPANTVTTVSWDSGQYRVTAGTLSKRFSVPVLFKPTTALLKTVTPDDWGQTGRYHGQIRVVHTTSGFLMINKLSMENYLRGVVPHEMSTGWPIEALKAQACAARSYAERSRNPGEAFDVYCTTRDQAYSGARVEHADTDAAVSATARVVPTYAGAPISAFYFSSSGGHTENIENVWQTAAVPYLKGVDDPYDTYATYHFWPENPRVLASTWYSSRLGAYNADTNPVGVKGTLRSIYVVKRGASPRVVRAAVIGSNGVTWVSGASLRYKLLLRDTWVSFRSFSIAAADTSLAYGARTTLDGRTYPGLADGAAATLHVYRNGAWTTKTVATTRHTQDLGSGHKASYSTFEITIGPQETSTYYVSYSTGRSAKVKVTVAPAVTATASKTTVAAGDQVTVSGAAQPALAGAKVVLQTKTGTAWANATTGALATDSTFSLDWTAVVGVSALRVKVPATAGLVTGYSRAILVTVS
jgi:stage II sporulation protein D